MGNTCINHSVFKFQPKYIHRQSVIKYYIKKRKKLTKLNVVETVNDE